jgi:hypothetical protein
MVKSVSVSHFVDLAAKSDMPWARELRKALEGVGDLKQELTKRAVVADGQAGCQQDQRLENAEVEDLLKTALPQAAHLPNLMLNYAYDAGVQPQTLPSVSSLPVQSAGFLECWGDGSVLQPSGPVTIDW